MSKRRAVVAVIDDNSGMLRAMNNILNVFGYDTELYASAQAFLNSATESEASCLLVDLQIGDVCGVAFARQLKALGCKFPIIFMTGSDNQEIERQALEAGCVALLHKPFPAAALVEALSKSTQVR